MRKGRDGQVLMIGNRLNGVGSVSWWNISQGTNTAWVRSLNGPATYVSYLLPSQASGGVYLHDAITTEKGELFVAGYRTPEDNTTASELFVHRGQVFGSEYTWKGSTVPLAFGDINVAFGIDIDSSGKIFVAGCGARASGSGDRDPVLLRLRDEYPNFEHELTDFPSVSGWSESTTVRCLSDGLVATTGTYEGHMRMRMFNASLQLQYYWWYGSGYVDRPTALHVGLNEDIIHYGAHRYGTSGQYGAFQVAPTNAVATNNAYSTQRHTPLSVDAPGILGNDFRVVGGTIVVTQNATQGQLTINQNGSFTYVPNACHTGTDSFKYRVDRVGAQSGEATVTITVSGNNLAPVANPDVVYTTQGQAVLLQPLLNDTDPDCDTLTVVSTSYSPYATLTTVAPNSIRYTPNSGAFVGVDFVSYQVTDGQGNTSQGAITIHVLKNVWPTNTGGYTPIAGNAAALKGIRASDGSYYVCGWESNGATIDAVLLKYSSTGTLVWRRYTNFYSTTWEQWRDLCEAPNGNIYVCGETQTTGGGVNTLFAIYTPSGSRPIFGTENGTSSEGYLGIRVDSAGNVLLAGYKTGASTGIDGWIRKTSSNFGSLWSTTFSGPGANSDYAFRVELDGAGNPVIGGYIVNANYDWRVAKYNASTGSVLWSYELNGAGNANDFFSDFALDSMGNIIAVGNSNGGSTNWDGTMVKLTANGAHDWTYRYNGPINGNEGATDVAINSMNQIAMSMESWNATDQDYAVAFVDPSGNELWSRRYNGIGGGTDIANAICFTPTGAIYVTGTSYGGSSTARDVMTLGYDQSGTVIWSNRYTGNGGNDDSRILIASPDGAALFQAMEINWLASGVDIAINFFQRAPEGSRG